MAFYRCVPFAKLEPSDDLPSGYTRVIYLYGSGTQYIITNYTPNSNTLIKAHLQDLSTAVSYLFGACRNYNDYCFSISYNKKGYSLYRVFVGKTVNAIGNNSEAMFMSKINEYVELSGTHVVKDSECQSILNGGEFVSPCNIAIFGRNTNGAIDTRYIAKMKVYDFAIYEGGECKISLIPCLDINGNPCLFDIVSQTPFYNLGTGTFGYELMDGTYVAPI